MILAKVIAIVKDDSGKLSNPDDFNAAIAAALKTYSKHRPDIAVEDITGNGTHDYDLPDAWMEGFSSISSIEYPMDKVPAELLDNDEYAVYQTPDGKKIRLMNDMPPTTDAFRLSYTLPRMQDTILANDEDALCNLSASFCLDQLANAFAQTSDSTIGADSVNYRTKSYEFAQRAKKHMQLYKEHVGIKEGDTAAPASAVVDLDEKYPGGGERLTHPRWARRKR